MVAMRAAMPIPECGRSTLLAAELNGDGVLGVKGRKCTLSLNQIAAAVAQMT
jgi:hypothetical protein